LGSEVSDTPISSADCNVVYTVPQNYVYISKRLVGRHTSQIELEHRRFCADYRI